MDATTGVLAALLVPPVFALLAFDEPSPPPQPATTNTEIAAAARKQTECFFNSIPDLRCIFNSQYLNIVVFLLLENRFVFSLFLLPSVNGVE
ncbi:hypothetical protein [Burkholderia sp. IT-111MI5]|uniref:hypothetical protein n=1 Tax=Burkholderia sp. IT-111MI5 TaxID=3026439 RepID=UPI0039E14AB9